MKTARSIILVVGALSLLGFSLAGAQEVNYSGSWALDKAKSTLQGRMNESLVSITLTITQKATDLTEEFQYKYQERDRADKIVLTIGGAEVEREGAMGRGKTKSQAKWSEDKKNLILTSESSFTTQSGNSMTIKSTDKYSLSADGKTLTISRESETPRGTQSSTMVFNKQ